MDNNNYEELKGSAKTFLQAVTSDNLYYGLFLLAVLIVALKLVDLIFRPWKKKKTSIHISFLKGCLKAFLIITIGMKICSLSETLSGFTSQILMSSSLIVVVLGFVFQELTTERMQAELDEMTAMIEPELNKHYQKWAGDPDTKIMNIDSPTTASGSIRYWRQRVDRLRNTVMVYRPYRFWGMVQEQFQLSNQQMLDYFGPRPADPDQK